MRLEDPIRHAFYYYNLNLPIQLLFTATLCKKKETQSETSKGGSFLLQQEQPRSVSLKAMDHEEKQFPT